MTDLYFLCCNIFHTLKGGPISHKNEILDDNRLLERLQRLQVDKLKMLRKAEMLRDLQRNSLFAYKLEFTVFRQDTPWLWTNTDEIVHTYL